MVQNNILCGFLKYQRASLERPVLLWSCHQVLLVVVSGSHWSQCWACTAMHSSQQRLQATQQKCGHSTALIALYILHTSIFGKHLVGQLRYTGCLSQERWKILRSKSFTSDPLSLKSCDISLRQRMYFFPKLK